MAARTARRIGSDSTAMACSGYARSGRWRRATSRSRPVGWYGVRTSIACRSRSAPRNSQGRTAIGEGGCGPIYRMRSLATDGERLPVCRFGSGGDRRPGVVTTRRRGGRVGAHQRVSHGRRRPLRHKGAVAVAGERFGESACVGHDHRFAKGRRELECPAVRGVDIWKRHYVGGGEEGGDVLLRDEAQMPGDRDAVPPGALHPLTDVIKRTARHQPDQVMTLGPRHLERLQEKVEAFVATDEPEEQRHATPGWEL